ncbi:hypothetical protein ACQ5SO_18260 [Rhodovulum sp. DZ06]|uniref:hypothetical protein n=1 Tax=Rhodovulum sp. DZ06 TaxID=3425126 RepID=UPI003D344DC2
MRAAACLGALLCAASLPAAPARAAMFLGPTGLPAPERVVGFEGAARAPGALVRGLARAGVTFSRPLALSPQRVDHVAGMSGAALGSHGDAGWTGALSILWAQDQEAAAFAFAAPGAWVEATALLDGKAVETMRWQAGWSNADTAYVGFTGVRFDEIRLRTDAALILLDNLQWGHAAPARAAAAGAAQASRAAPPGLALRRDHAATGGQADRGGAAEPGMTADRGTAAEPGMTADRGAQAEPGTSADRAGAAEPGATARRPQSTGEGLQISRAHAPLSSAPAAPLSVGAALALEGAEEPPMVIPLPGTLALLSGAFAALGVLRLRGRVLARG